MEKKAVRRIRHTSILLLVMLASLLLFFDLRTDSTVSTPAAEGPLCGHIIAIDPGHGGYDGGAKAPSGIWEKVYNLSVSLKLREYLHSLGATVIMTRDDDYALCDINPPIRKKRQDMERRAELVLIGNAELLVSIHMNEYKNKSQSGPQVFYRADCEASRTLSGILQESMTTELIPKQRRQALAGDFYMLSLGIPSALVECGFLSNVTEEALLRTKTYEERVAKAIGDGIVAWFALETRPVAAERENR